MNDFADLHLHSRFSDGTFTPEEIVARGRAHGLRALALTDHDSVEGCERMAGSCIAAGVEFIPACELTAEHEDDELHLLAYFVETTHPHLLAEIEKFQTVRQNRIREMVAKLNRLGIPLEAKRVFALANCRSPGRPHIARALVDCRLCGTLDEAFERFLKRNRPAWVPKYRMSAVEAIDLIHEAGGLAVLAHPGLNHSDAAIPALVEAGMDGIECWHTKHSTFLTERYMEMADQYGLVITGGSDCHGESKSRPLIGSIRLPYQHVENLKLASVERRARPAAPAAPLPSTCLTT